MPDENVEIVRRVFDFWNAGDMDRFVEAHDPDVVVIAPEGWPEGAVSEGIEAWRLQAERLRETWEEARTEIDEIRSAGDDRVVARVRYVTRGHGTNLPFDTPLSVLFFLRGGRITRAQYYWDAGEAFEAAGLSN